MDTPPVYQFLATPDHELTEGVWRLETGAGVDDIAPDSRCELIFHLAEPPEEKTASGWVRQPAHMVYGPLTRVLHLRRASPMTVMAIRLKPHGIGALTAKPRVLRNRSRNLTALLPPASITDLANAAQTELHHFSEVARTTLQPVDGWATEAFRIIKAMKILEQEMSIRAIDLADRLGISRRTLDRDFMRYTGLTPGEFARINRYQAAHAAIREGALALSDIAVLSGYSDQAHMTREFRRLAGLTPRRKRNREGLDVFYEDVASSST